MWKRAKTTPQKMAVLDGFLPITANDFIKAVVYFSGDDDEFVWKKAVEKLKDFSQEEIRRHIDEDLPLKSALAISEYAADKKDPSLIILLVSSRKLDPAQLLNYIQIQDVDFWRTLVAHKDFVTFSYKFKDDYIAFLSGFSQVLSDLYVEQAGYVSENDLEKEAEQANKEEVPEIHSETESQKSDAIIDEDEEVVTLGDEDFDFPDFLTTENAFEGLSADESIEKKKNLVQMMKDMSIGAKIKLATTGNMEVRKILIKDPRKIIAMAVLGNPKITEKEVIGIASDNAISIDIITHIANTKSLSKNYRVKLALVMNPKTPLRTALQFMELLRMNDLKKVAKSRDIPNALKMKALKKVK
jgi:hypothetical protein